jgi:hypothetical protein
MVTKGKRSVCGKCGRPVYVVKMRDGTALVLEISPITSDGVGEMPVVPHWPSCKPEEQKVA